MPPIDTKELLPSDHKCLILLNRYGG